jgi:hypothetical protein
VAGLVNLTGSLVYDTNEEGGAYGTGMRRVC